MQDDPRFAAWTARVERTLDRALRALGPPQRLREAMRYAVLNGGKRLRPLLVYAAGVAVGAEEENLDAPAAAVELIHAFSLVHDDLPAMDNDALRRGHPTVHIAFDEACAILAGDALQTLAFELLAGAKQVPPEIRIAWVRELAAASGAEGMCGGQALDMAGTGCSLSLTELENLHALKTGSLIRAAVRMGAAPGARAGVEATAALDAYGSTLGLAFQIRNDILDLEGDSAQLGKTAGKDKAQGKSTYPALLGVSGSKRLLEELVAQMETELAFFGERADALRAIARFAVVRAH